MLKLLVYAKIQHINRTSVIADMAMYHDIYKYVCDDIRPSGRSIQRYRREYCHYFETLLQMTLKKAFDEGFTEFNHVVIDRTIKKAYNSNNNTITKKETQSITTKDDQNNSRTKRINNQTIYFIIRPFLPILII